MQVSDSCRKKMTMAKMALLLVAFVALQAVQAKTRGLSCVEFDSMVCKGQEVGAMFDNIADCGAPFCHTTYVVCEANDSPAVVNCLNDTVWDMSAMACIKRIDAPGGCPATCGLLNATMCGDMVDGTRLLNPTDCEVAGISTYIYCQDKLPIISYCPKGTKFENSTKDCVDGSGIAVKALPPNPPREIIMEVAPAPAPAQLALAPEPMHDMMHDKPHKTKEEIEQEMAAAPAPSWEPVQWSNVSFMIQGKDLVDLTPSVVESALKNVTGKPSNVHSIQYEVMEQVTLSDLDFTVDDAAKTDLEAGLSKLFGEIYPGYAVEVDLLDDGTVSTASIEEGSNVQATIKLIPSDNEYPDELVNSIKDKEAFKVVLAQALEAHGNETAAHLGVSPEMAAYLQREAISLDDYTVGAVVVVEQPGGAKGEEAIMTALENGSLTGALATELGQSTNDVKVEEHTAEEDGTRDITIPTDNAAFAAGARAATVLAGAAAVLALLL